MTLPDPFKLPGKRILVTGASSGIGRACCLQIAAQGGHVVALGRDAARLDETLQLCSGADHFSVAVDITDDLGIEAAIKGMPTLNGVVHAAGRCLLNPVRFLKKKEFSSLMDVNAIAAFALTARLLKAKLLSEESSLVFITSVSGLTGEAGMVEYSTTKGAVLSGARSLALELARQKIRVNCVAPGSVRTPMLEALEQRMTENAIQENTQLHPLGIGFPEDVAFAVNYLLASASRWVTGTTLVVDGGYSAQ